MEEGRRQKTQKAVISPQHSLYRWMISLGVNHLQLESFVSITDVIFADNQASCSTIQIQSHSEAWDQCELIKIASVASITQK